MWKIFKRREELILVGLSAFFLICIALVFVWGIKVLIGNFDAAFGNSGAPPSTASFNIDEAKKLLKARGFPE